MKLEDALKVLQSSDAEHTYEIYIPSIQKDLTFKPITTGLQKQISKFSLNNLKFNYTYELIKLSLFDELKVSEDEISADKLTELDMLSFFAGLRMNNIVDPLEINLTCTSCDAKFLYKIPLEKILKNIKKYETPEFMYEREVHGVSYKLTISDPTYVNLVELEEYLNLVSQQDEDVNISELRALSKPACFIREVEINGEKIDEFKNSDFIDKLKFYNELPPLITIDGADSIFNLIIDKFNLEKIQDVFPKIKCAKCKTVLEGALANDSFFII